MSFCKGYEVKFVVSSITLKNPIFHFFQSPKDSFYNYEKTNKAFCFLTGAIENRILKKSCKLCCFGDSFSCYMDLWDQSNLDNRCEKDQWYLWSCKAVV